MTVTISPLAHVDPRAELGCNVVVGPFCLVGRQAIIGDDCVLHSHVAVVGNTVIGQRNRFFPNTVIGGEPQDAGCRGSDTRLLIGDDNVFREGVTVHRGARKEDHTTRIGNGNMLMANSHVAHNCHVFNNVFLVNGVLLGGHVHVHDGAIVSGNSVVHHFSTLGRLSFVSGGSRVPHDIPPFMLAAGSDNPTVRTVNVVGMQRAGIHESTIRVIKSAHRLLFRQKRSLDDVRKTLLNELSDVLPLELTCLLDFVERQQNGRMGRAREALHFSQGTSSNQKRSNAAEDISGSIPGGRVQTGRGGSDEASQRRAA